jgi:hypothetical protein
MSYSKKKRFNQEKEKERDRLLKISLKKYSIQRA